MDVLVIDIGGTHVKMRVNNTESRRFPSGARLTPDALVERVREYTSDWRYDVISVGFPGAVRSGRPTAEPGNLGRGWIGFDFAAALGRPVRLVNDAVLQALGAYDGGRMLFLGLGTGLGSCLVTEHVAVPLELGALPLFGRSTIADRIGRRGLEVIGTTRWRRDVQHVIRSVRVALAADYVVLGGGNAKLVRPLPRHTRRGSNEDAFVGGFRLWEEIVEPHDRQPAAGWRVVT